MRYRLRTLLILLALGPPLLWFGWSKYGAWRAEQERRASLQAAKTMLIIDEDTAWQSRLREYSEPPAAPMQPGEVDMRKLTRPGE
jgi:hypothetical protein